MRPWATGWRGHGLALLGYLGVAVWLTWPAVTHMTSQIATSGHDIFFYYGSEDVAQNVWNLWWFQYALRHGLNPFFSVWLYHPEGVQFYLQTLNSVAALPMVPVAASLGPVAAYNVAILVAFTLTGYAGWLLARAFGAQHPAAAWLSGALLTAAPFHSAKLAAGQLNFVSLQWLVFYLLALALVLRQRQRWAIGLAVLLFPLVVLTDWYWGLVAGVTTLVWSGLMLVAGPARRQLFGYLLALGLGLGLVTFLLVLGALAVREPTRPDPVDRTALWAAYTEGNSSDALGLLYPAALNPLWALPVERFLKAVAPHGISEGSYTAAGWVLLALASLGVVWYGRREWPLLGVALVAWLLSLGPTLYLLGWPTGVALPYQLIQLVPLLETARRPNIFGAVSMIIAMIFAAMALQRLVTQRPSALGSSLASTRPVGLKPSAKATKPAYAGYSGDEIPQAERLAAITPQRRWLLVGIALLAAFELWPPLRFPYPLAQAEVFTRLADRPGVVVDLPVEDDLKSRSLSHQMQHEQPILRGYVARPPTYPTLRYAPLVNALGRMQPWPERDLVTLDQAAWQQQQCYYQLRHVVLDETLVTPAEQAQLLTNLERLLGYRPEPWYAQDGRRAYELPLFAGQCAPFAFLGAGWHGREQQAEQVWRWTDGASEVYLVNPANVPQTVSLRLLAEAPEAGRTLTIQSEHGPSMQVDLARQERWYHVPVRVEPGLNRLVLRSATTADPAGGRALGLVVRQIGVGTGEER